MVDKLINMSSADGADLQAGSPPLSEIIHAAGDLPLLRLHTAVNNTHTYKIGWLTGSL